LEFLQIHTFVIIIISIFWRWVIADNSSESGTIRFVPLARRSKIFWHCELLLRSLRLFNLCLPMNCALPFLPPLNFERCQSNHCQNLQLQHFSACQNCPDSEWPVSPSLSVAYSSLLPCVSSAVIPSAIWAISDGTRLVVTRNMTGWQRFYVYFEARTSSCGPVLGPLSCIRQSHQPETVRVTSEICDTCWQRARYRAWTKRSRILWMVGLCAFKKRLQSCVWTMYNHVQSSSEDKVENYRKVRNLEK
jgi:hypothetical protein